MWVCLHDMLIKCLYVMLIKFGLNGPIGCKLLVLFVLGYMFKVSYDLFLSLFTLATHP